MMRTRLIVENGFRATQTGTALAIRLPWYRTLPLSVIDLPVVKIDGQTIDPAHITLEVNGRMFDAATVRAAEDVWWYVLDPGLLHIAGLAMRPGEAHDVTVEVSFAPPYIPEITLFCAATKAMSLAPQDSGRQA